MFKIRKVLNLLDHVVFLLLVSGRTGSHMKANIALEITTIALLEIDVSQRDFFKRGS